MKSSSRTLLQSLRAGIIGLVGALCALAPAHAQQVPDRLNYQGMLRKGDGTPEPPGYKEIEFRIYDAPTSGALLWARSHLVNLDSNGLFNVVLMEGGSPIGSPRYTDLTSVFADREGEGRYLELAVAGSNPIQPRQRFVPAAYAFLAANVVQAKENFTVAGSLTVQSQARVNALTVDTTATLSNATFLGKVGIGTTTPSNALTVNGDMELGVSSGDYQHLRLGGGNSYGYLYGSWPLLGDGIHLGYNYYADANGVGQVHNKGGQTSRLTLGYGRILLATAGVNAAPTNRMIVDQNGNVGIGTTTPSRLLQVGDINVANSQGMIRLASRSGNSSDRRTWDIGVPETDSSLNGIGYGFVIDDPQHGPIPELFINYNFGRVGISTINPQRLLQVGDVTNYSEGMIRLASRSSDGQYYRSWDIGAPISSPVAGGIGYSFVIDDPLQPGVEFIIRYQNGNVGIGTNDPSAKLHVNGTVKVTGLGTGTGSTVRYNTLTGALGYDSSSRRYKENIHSFKTDWFSLLHAEPVTYTRPGSPNAWEIGFIAEDFDALGLGALVLYDEAGRPDAIQYDRITLYLLQIAKAQQKELAEKTARLEALERSVTELKAMVSALAEKVEGGGR